MQTPRSLNAKHWRFLLWRNGGGAVWILLFAWGLLLAFGLGLDLRSSYRRAMDAATGQDWNSERQAGMVATSLRMAIIVSCLVAARFIWRLHRAQTLARYGVSTMGTVRRFGGLVDWNMFRKVVFSYMHEGKPYQCAIWGEDSCELWGIDEVELGQKVPVVFDPRNPTRAMLAKDVFPLAAVEASEIIGEADLDE